MKALFQDETETILKVIKAIANLRLNEFATVEEHDQLNGKAIEVIEFLAETALKVEQQREDETNNLRRACELICKQQYTGTQAEWENAFSQLKSAMATMFGEE